MSLYGPGEFYRSQRTKGNFLLFVVCSDHSQFRNVEKSLSFSSNANTAKQKSQPTPWPWTTCVVMIHLSSWRTFWRQAKICWIWVSFWWLQSWKWLTLFYRTTLLIIGAASLCSPGLSILPAGDLPAPSKVPAKSFVGLWAVVSLGKQNTFKVSTGTARQRRRQLHGGEGFPWLGQCRWLLGQRYLWGPSVWRAPKCTLKWK